MCEKSITLQHDEKARRKNSFPDMEKIFPCQIEKNFPLDIIPLDYRETYILPLIWGWQSAGYTIPYTSKGYESGGSRPGVEAISYPLYPCSKPWGQNPLVSHMGRCGPNAGKSPEKPGFEGFGIEIYGNICSQCMV